MIAEICEGWICVRLKPVVTLIEGWLVTREILAKLVKYYLKHSG